MIEDPYKILGLQPDATADEIKKAYRQMAKIYHPDLHPDDPDIHEKMNAVNEAYDMLTHPTKYANKRAQEEAKAQPNDFQVVSEREMTAQQVARPTVQPEDSPEIQQAVAYLNNNQFQDAIQVLTHIPSTGRNARWYYLSALANQMMGNYILATDQMQRASQLEPQNQTYMQLLFQFQRAGQIYEKNAKGFTFTPMTLGYIFCGGFFLQLFFGPLPCCIRN